MALAIDLSGKRAVVTGAGKGIGRACAIALASAGADVFAVSRTADELASLADEVRAHGVRFGSAPIDLCEAGAPARVAALAADAIGDVDVLVNNAGVAIVGPAESVAEADWDTVMNTNARAAFFTAQAFGQGMLARGRGRIVNVTSQAGVVGLTDHAAYCASKAALGMLTKVLAIEWGRRGVTVNAVAPTVILTPLGERVWGDPAKGNPMLAKIPVGRFGRPPEVAWVVAFLASDESSLINGETILIDGGYTAQ
jgi:2-deoxy-D-gluconate 3-dehydrogenase